MGQQQNQSRGTSQDSERDEPTQDQSGDPRPQYDQYKLGSAPEMQRNNGDDALRREQAGAQSDAGTSIADEEEHAEDDEAADEASQRGYGSAGEERLERD